MNDGNPTRSENVETYLELHVLFDMFLCLQT